MKILKNNINKTILGVVLAIFIIGTGLYTLAAIKEPSKAPKAKAITANFLVNKGIDNFEQRGTVDVSTGCSTPASLNCVYTVTASGKANIPNTPPYTNAQISQFVTNGWLTVAPGSSAALYSL